eukprot:2013093-Prymnesium_polylepis.1
MCGTCGTCRRAEPSPGSASNTTALARSTNALRCEPCPANPAASAIGQTDGSLRQQTREPRPGGCGKRGRVALRGA